MAKMNRRNFFKNLGKIVAGAAIASTGVGFNLVKKSGGRLFRFDVSEIDKSKKLAEPIETCLQYGPTHIVASTPTGPDNNFRDIWAEKAAERMAEQIDIDIISALRSKRAQEEYLTASGITMMMKDQNERAKIIFGDTVKIRRPNFLSNITS